MKKLIILCLTIFIVVGFLLIQAQAATQIATINIDGDKSDWASLTPAVDAEGNSVCGATGDIKAVYTAKDDTHIYFMVETYGTPIDTSHDASVGIDMDFKPGDQWPWGNRTDLALRFNQDGYGADLDSDGDGTPETVTLEGVQIAWGADFVEGSIPLSALGDPDYFQLEGAGIWDSDAFPSGTQDNTCNYVQINPPQGIEYMYVQRRNYETDEGIAIQNRLYFSMYDLINTTLGDVLDTAILYDPTGKEVEFTMVPTYDPSNILMGNYDINTGHWKLDSGFDYFDNGYSAKFEEDLVPGYYRLHVTTLAGEVDERLFKVSQPVDDAPIISSSSFRAWKDSSGNLTWKWDVPYDLDPDLNTRVSAYMAADGDGDNFFWINVPTHVGSLRIPKTTLDLLEATDDKISMRLYLRINDEEGNNFQRNVSNAVSLKEAMVIPPVGDVNNDGKIGLPEAIHALQVITNSN